MLARQNFTPKSRLFCIFLLTLTIGYYYYYFINYSPNLNFRQRMNLFNSSKSCLIDAFQTFTSETFVRKWVNLDETVDKCNGDLLKAYKIEEFQNLDEKKRGILPKYSNSECTVITLGIGKDVLAEKEISKKLSQCTFLGIDPDSEISGILYKSELKGKYVQGVIGANNSIKDVPKENKVPQYPNFSFEKFISLYFPHQTLDFLLIDIEEDEWELMKDLINNPDKYPTICQINVEYHNPQSSKAYSSFEDIYRSLQFGPYYPIRVELNKEYLFNRIFFVNFKNDYCIEKYL